MVTIKSKDGTPIACSHSGAGTVLVLVHGTAADHTRWAPVLPALEKEHAVYAVDRRGCGESGDTDPYSVEREYEDVAAVIDSAPEPVNILAHSHGAICSLEAALITKNIARLILYEPPLPTGSPVYPVGTAERIQGMVDSENRDEAVATFFREVVRMPDQQIENLRSLPVWKARVAAAHTISREMTADEQYKFVPDRFRRVNVPTLLLLGGDSPSFMKNATELVNQALPNSRIAIMPGQRHIGMNTAPELFTKEFLTFLAV